MLEQLGNFFFRRRGPLSGVVLVLVVVATGATAARRPVSPTTGRAADLLGLAIVLLSLAGRGVVVGYSAPGTSGRNQEGQVAESLNTRGGYSVVRHPIYLLNLLGWVGIAVLSGTWWIPIGALALGVGLYGPIIVAEDAFLDRRFGAAHRDWVARTSAVRPRTARWRRPERRFSWRAVLRREYPSLAVTSISAYLVHAARGWPAWRPDLGGGWTPGLLVALALAAALRIVSHTTRWFEPGGER
jgi:protein-S-isoprenylcysteine O-methyltransferase Ste14